MKMKILPSKMGPKLLWKLPFFSTDRGLNFLEGITKDSWLTVRHCTGAERADTGELPFLEIENALPQPVEEMHKKYEDVVVADVWPEHNEIVVKYL